MTGFWLLFVLAVLSAFGLTGLVRKAALRRGVLDIPNQRSSHSVPTPRGGGLAIVLVVAAGSICLWARGVLTLDILLPVVLGGSAVALVGFFDDRIALSARLRFAVHLLAAASAVAWLGGLPSLPAGDGTVDLGWGGDLIAIVGIVWTLNLFNFMDGIDGIAGAEAVCVGAGGGLLLALGGAASAVAPLAWLVSAASLGFLLWNWPPAKIFMGDVGSGYLGYLFGVLGLAAIRENPAMLYVWLILGGVFIVDATVTLFRRLARRERFHEAHRSHAYQTQARRWGSHLRVTVAVVLLNVLWLAPWAWWALEHSANGAWGLAISWAPLVVLAMVCGAGRKEH